MPLPDTVPRARESSPFAPVPRDRNRCVRRPTPRGLVREGAASWATRRRSPAARGAFATPKRRIRSSANRGKGRQKARDLLVEQIARSRHARALLGYCRAHHDLFTTLPAERKVARPFLLGIGGVRSVFHREKSLR